MYDIHDFIKEALGRGLHRDAITNALRAAKWSEAEIHTSLDNYAEVDFPIPVPRRRPYLSAREAFTYLLLFLCLYISSWSFGSLVFNFISRLFPDPLRLYDAINDSSIRSAVAALIVSFPLFLWLSVTNARAIQRDPEKRASKIRKWLSYVTLFIAAGVIIGDIITLLYNFLGGDLTTQFILKVVTILFIAGNIFGYYLWDLRRDEKHL